MRQSEGDNIFETDASFIFFPPFKGKSNDWREFKEQVVSHGKQVALSPSLWNIIAGSAQMFYLKVTDYETFSIESPIYDLHNQTRPAAKRFCTVIIVDLDIVDLSTGQIWLIQVV